MEKGSAVNYWKPEEDQLAIELFNDLIINKSLTLTEAKSVVAEKVNRTYESINYRYHRKFRTALKPEALEKIKENSISNITKKNNKVEDGVDSMDLFHLSVEDSEQAASSELEQKIPSVSEFQTLIDRVEKFKAIQQQIEELQEKSKVLQAEIKPFTEYLVSIVNKK